MMSLFQRAITTKEEVARIIRVICKSKVLSLYRSVQVLYESNKDFTMASHNMAKSRSPGGGIWE